MEIRWTPIARCVGGWMGRAATGLGVVFAIAAATGVLARAGDDSTRSSRKDAGASPAFIDKVIEEGWKKAGVKPAKAGTDEEFLRRAYLDLLGRIPNVQEARAFLSTRENDKRDKLVEYLLNHPDFAKNFATQWTVLLIGRGNQGRMVDRAFA